MRCRRALGWAMERLDEKMLQVAAKVDVDAPPLALIVDDDPILLEIMAARLDVIGFKAILAENGMAAIKALEENDFCVAIVDLRMPELDGFGLLQFIRERPASADLPVIVATTSEDQASIEKAYRLAASSFTTKPINLA